VDEGKFLCPIVRQSGRVFQTGTWRRSHPMFRLGCEMVHAGRVGKLQKVTVTLGKNKTGGPFATQDPPAHLNWDMWLGQTPLVPYCPQRCHNLFRWWYEYSGGQMTDWGAHHIDIAQWGMGADDTGPVEIDGQAKFPDVPNGFNVAIDFRARLKYANGVELEILDEGRSGILFEGDRARIFVNEGGVYGTPADQLKDHPLPRDQYKLYPKEPYALAEGQGRWNAHVNHMANFFHCIKTRNTNTLSNVTSQHRTASLCHLANISMRLGRKLRWDPVKELFVGDDEANGRLRRERRKPYVVDGG